MSGPPTDRSVARAICRTNFFVFSCQAFAELHPGVTLDHAPYIEALCYAVQRVADGYDRRLNINVPPRHLKSFLVSVALPAWMMGRDPRTKVLFAAYGQDLADEHSRNFLKLVRAPFYRALFPSFAIARAVTGDISTTLGGYRRATGAGGSVTGFGADLIIVDDLSKAADAHSPANLESALTLYRETVLSRFNNKSTGRLIAIQQRLHENDLSGHLQSDRNFRHVVLPSIAVEREVFPLYNGRIYAREPGDLLHPTRENRETLDNLRREMGDAVFSAQYQQNPIPPGGNRIRWDWFEHHDDLPEREDLHYVVQSWDTAVTGAPTSDWSVCMTFGLLNGRWLLVDLYRARVDYPDLRRQAMAQARRWRPEIILVEAAGTGHALARELRDDPAIGCNRVITCTPGAGKEIRLEAQTARLEQGFVMLPANAPWLGDLRHELLGFPNARHDDQVDALTQFVDWAGSNRAQGELEVSKYGRQRDVQRR